MAILRKPYQLCSYIKKKNTIRKILFALVKYSRKGRLQLMR
jgi:hypothetical protein